jgi:hypothetical protein
MVLRDARRLPMIDGLKLTVSGKELRAMLEKGIRSHEQQASRWTHETIRTSDDETEGAPLLPQHMCGNEAQRHMWRAGVLAFMRDHIDAGEMYRLGAADLEYGELLSAKPGWLEQDEYEARTRIGFSLERLVRSVDSVVGVTAALHRRAGSDSDESGIEGAPDRSERE